MCKDSEAIRYGFVLCLIRFFIFVCKQRLQKFISPRPSINMRLVLRETNHGRIFEVHLNDFKSCFCF